MHYQPQEWQISVDNQLHPFHTFTKTTALSCKAGIYIFGYTHLRGHLAGFQMNILHINEGHSFEEALEKASQVVNLDTLHWNSVYYCQTEKAPQQRQDLVQSMRRVTSPVYSS